MRGLKLMPFKSNVFHTHKDCFSGSFVFPLEEHTCDPFRFSGDAMVSWLVDNSAVDSREEGILMGERFFQAGVLECVNGRTGFKDDGSIYRFVQVTTRSQLPVTVLALRPP